MKILIITIILTVVGFAMSATETTGMENKFVISANGKEMTATFADNSSAIAFRDLIADAPLTVEMSDFGDFEKVGDLGHTLPVNDSRITTQPGDVILYLGSNVTIYYGVNTWTFTPLGKIDGNPTRQSILSVLGDGSVNVTFSLSSTTSGVSETVAKTGLFKVDVKGRYVTVEGKDIDKEICIYTIDGKLIYRGKQRRVALPQAGTYLIVCDDAKTKVMVR